MISCTIVNHQLAFFALGATVLQKSHVNPFPIFNTFVNTCCASAASTLHQLCINSASTLHQLCINSASTLHQLCMLLWCKAVPHFVWGEVLVPTHFWLVPTHFWLVPTRFYDLFCTSFAIRTREGTDHAQLSSAAGLRPTQPSQTPLKTVLLW